MKITGFKTTAVDVLMPDLQRAGGRSEMRRITALASCYAIPISTHVFTE
ncbi:MAG: enolase C-terminal domain-like protein [Gammaproteobacteria bacterium]